VNILTSMAKALLGLFRCAFTFVPTPHVQLSSYSITSNTVNVVAVLVSLPAV